MNVTKANFREILQWVGYYDREPFMSAQEAQRYLSPRNMTLAFGGGLRLTETELSTLAELAVRHQEHMS